MHRGLRRREPGPSALPADAEADVFAGSRVRLRLARVSGVDPQRRTVAVTLEDGDGELAYDTLLFALGSSVTHHDVPGVVA
ncbi:hypothetical protein KPP03845_106779 [Streptomyces xanthophaeus]|nr:hypothetical protein KPP03845_106779 [Streptomyces xanthophaeus]